MRERSSQYSRARGSPHDMVDQAVFIFPVLTVFSAKEPKRNDHRCFLVVSAAVHTCREVLNEAKVE